MSVGEIGPSQMAVLIMDWSMLAVITIVEGFVFFRLKFKFDFTGQLTLYLQLLVSIIRVINNYYSSDSALQVIIIVIANSLIYISLYYFTFELLSIVEALKSSSISEFSVKQYRILWIKWSSIGLVLVYCIISCILYWYQYTNSSFYINNRQSFNLAFVICRTVKFVCDIFVSAIFIIIMKFLLKYRGRTERKFTKFNRFILGMVFAVFLMNLAQVTMIFIVIFFQINDPFYF